jgi:hypothetical protein
MPNTPNRWGIRNAGVASFYSLVDGSAIVTLSTLKTSGVETTGETVYSRGGDGNVKIIPFSSNREAKLTLEDAVFDNDAIGMITGNTVATGVKTIDFNEIVTVATNAAVLTKTPVGAILSVYEVNPDGTNKKPALIYTSGSVVTGGYKNTVKNLTLFAGDFADGKKLRVYYNVATDATAKSVKVTSDKFGQSFRVTVDVLVRDEFTLADYKGQIRIAKAKFEDNFNFSLT